MQDTGGMSEHRVSIRPATMEDRRVIWEWMAQSDLTDRMMGPPVFPDMPLPSFEEFLEDYPDYFFDNTRPRQGRCFVVELGGEPIGQINHDRVTDGVTELDIWLAGSRWAGKGHGVRAVDALCRRLADELGCTRFIIAAGRLGVVLKTKAVPATVSSVLARRS